MLASRTSARARARLAGARVRRRLAHVRTTRAAGRSRYGTTDRRRNRDRALACAGGRRAGHRRRRDRSVRVRVARRVSRGDGTTRAAPGVDQSRIPERRGLGRGLPSASVAASALSAAEDVLLPGPVGRHRRRAEGARPRRAAHRIRNRCGRARRVVAACDRRRAAGARHDGRQPVRLRESGRERAARTVARRRGSGRRARADGPRIAGRRTLFRGRVLRRGRTRSERQSGRARARVSSRRPIMTRLLWAADVNFVRGGRFVRTRAMGAQAVRLAHLPTGGRRAPAEARCRARASVGPVSPTRRARRSSASGTRGTAPARPTGPISGSTARRCNGMPSAGPTRSRRSAILPQSWPNMQNLS
ncbi:hypothetical protein BDAG_02081 [Burkholderia dolosa AU0158]|nr:hypothetical protein BDAG_02081 [Burkholderia dolosa AU0158]